MLNKVINTIKKYSMLEEGERILVALSGGVDSSVLLDVLTECSEKLGITVCAAHLNHMLRGEDANRDEEFVREKCKRYGVNLVCERRDIAGLASECGESVETCARNVRYDFLKCAAKALGASKIATAHNANDGLETVIFNIARGGGTDALCGIPPVRDNIIRPIIEIPREEIEAYAIEKGIDYCIDKTNSETVYTRNRIRHNIIPEMLKINAAAVRNAARSAEILREESDFLRELAANEAKRIAKSETSCSAFCLAKVHKALFARVCEVFAGNAFGRDEYTLEQRHISDIYRLCESKSPSARISLPMGLCARREYDEIIFEVSTEKEVLQPIDIFCGEFRFGKYSISAKKTEENGKINNSLNTFYVPCDRIQNGLKIRTRKTGDEIKLINRPKKSLKKLFIEARIPKDMRDGIPVLADGDNVLAVYGFGQDERSLPKDEKEKIYIEIRCGENEK